MQSRARLLTSSIGMKIIMAVTGAGLVVFIIAHMMGNLEIFGGPDAINGYGARLRYIMPLLWTARAGLLVFAILHIVSAVRLTRLNLAARPVHYVKKKSVRTTLAARTMMVSGTLLAIFVVFHILHFTLRTIQPEYQHWDDTLGRHDVYRMVVDAFQKPAFSIGYILAMIFLGLHLSHGVSSMFQTLGVSHPRYFRAVRRLGPVFAVIIVLGFIAVPIAVLLGLVKPSGGGS